MVTSAVLLMAAIGAHLLACGTLISPLPLIATAMLIVLTVSMLMHKRLSRVRALALAIAVQVGTHYLLGVSSMKMMSPMCGGSNSYFVIPMSWTMNHWVMFGAHSVSAIVSYLLIQYSETIWHLARIHLLAPERPAMLSFESCEKSSVRTSRVEAALIRPRIQTFLTEACSRLSAPPTLITQLTD